MDNENGFNTNDELTTQEEVKNEPEFNQEALNTEDTPVMFSSNESLGMSDNEEEPEEENKKNKKLLLLLLLLVGTGIILGTSTFAWFTANKTVAVNDINVNVAAQNGIQISVDGISWKSIVQTADLTGAATTYPAAVNQMPTDTNSLAPVSTVGNTDTNGHMEMFLGEVNSQTSASSPNYGEYILSATKETETHGTSGNFIAFDLFFKVENTTPIWITANSGVTTSDTVHMGIKNATRMAFVIEGNTATGSATSTIQGLNGGTSAPVYIWEPNYDVHSASGVANALDVYGLTTTQTSAAQLAYSGVKAEITDANDVALKAISPSTHTTLYGSYFANVTPTYSTVEGFTEAIDGWTFNPGITKVRVYMWVEGQDVDCENTASGGNVTYKLQITSEDPDATP